jgi:FAD/FMN-containing dehydrogenase
MLATGSFACTLGSPLAPRRAHFLVRSAEDLRRAVRAAQGSPLLFDASALDRVLSCDTAGGLVEVQSEATWTSLAQRFADRAPELSAFAEDAWLPERIGASVARNAIAPGGATLVKHVESVALVTPDGELQRVSRRFHPELFRLAIGGHGAFGPLYSVTLRIDSLARSAKNACADAVLELDSTTTSSLRRIELYAPPERVDDLLARIRDLAADWRTAIARIEVRRVTADHETALHLPLRQCAALALHLHVSPGLGGSVRAKQLGGELIGAALEHGGAFSLATGSDASREQVEACYPRFSSFLAEKRCYDPLDSLHNDWYRHFRNLFRQTACTVRWSDEELAAPAVAS